MALAAAYSIDSPMQRTADYLGIAIKIRGTIEELADWPISCDNPVAPRQYDTNQNQSSGGYFSFPYIAILSGQAGASGCTLLDRDRPRCIARFNQRWNFASLGNPRGSQLHRECRQYNGPPNNDSLHIFQTETLGVLHNFCSLVAQLG